MRTRNQLLIPVLALLCAAGRAEAAPNLRSYDDALQNAFENYSYGSLENLSSASVVYAGSYAISFAPRDWGAVSFYSPVVLSTSDYQGLELWIHGGTGGGQEVELAVLHLTESGQTVKASALVSTLLGGPIPANTWVRLAVSFDTGPMAFSGSFNRFWLQDAHGNPQATVYLDDIVVQGRPSSPPPPSPPPPPPPPPPSDPNAMLIERDVTHDSMVSDRFSWRDRSGLPRSATFPHNTGQTGPVGTRGGELRELRYQITGGTTRTVRAPAISSGGFGYVVSHMSDPSMAYELGQNDSPLGHHFTGDFSRVLQGRHHVIHRFTQYYPRYGRVSAGAPVTTYQVPVVVEWLIANGRSNPLWSVSYDLSVAPVNVISADSRAPYGELLFDGAPNENVSDTIGGIAWGDRYKFTTTAGPVTLDSPWTWNTPNTVPHVMLWKQITDAEMGTVLTRTLTQQDAGGYWGYEDWNKTSSQVMGCNFPGGSDPVVHSLPCTYNWPFQSINYQLFYQHTPRTLYATNRNRLAWGTNLGFLGKAQYPEHGCANWDCAPMRFRSGYPRQSYSTYIVLGEHSKAGVAAQVTQVENVQLSTLTASVGTVRTQGPAGVGRTDLTSYSPVGYNHVYGTWDVTAVDNGATVSLSGGGSGLDAPILVLHGYTSATPPTLVTLDGQALAADTDYYATVDTSGQRLWVTVNRLWTGVHTLALSAQ